MCKHHLFHSLVLCSIFSLGFADGGESSNAKDSEVWTQKLASRYEEEKRENDEVSDDNEYCDTRARPVRITMRHIENRGIGYNTGYTTLEGFFALAPRSNVVPFLDLRGHMFNDNKWAANGGLGIRFLPDNSEVVFGINAFYDFRHVSHKSFQQAGAGLEFLGHVWEGRINGYLPFGDKRGPYSETKFDSFKGNHIILQRRAQFAMRGLDAEAGAYLCQMEGFNAFFGAGPYGFTAERGKAAIGAKGRLTVDLSDYVTAQVTASYDSVFRGIVQGELMINIPFFLKETTKRPKGAFKSCETWSAMKNRLLDRVYREEIIVVKKRTKRDTAIDPTTGQPYRVLFVNNTSHSAGTYASPFSTLIDAEHASKPGNIIYVFSGDGTSNGMEDGIVLQDNQRLWGAATRHHLNTTLGRIVVPQHDTVAPIITNLIIPTTFTGGVVQIANNNEISGFTIQNEGLNGIFQIAGFGVPTLSGLRVLNNSIVGNGFGTAVSANKITGAVTISNNNFNQSGGGSGIGFGFSNSHNAHVTIKDNTMEIESGDGIDLFLTNCYSSDFFVLNNAINASNIGIGITIDNALSIPNTFVVSGNNVSAVNNNAISLHFFDSANTIMEVSSNNLSSQITNTVLFDFLSSFSQVSIANNNITSQASGGIFMVATGTTGINVTASVSIINNNVSIGSAGTNCMNIGANGGAIAQYVVTNNNLSVATPALGAAAIFPVSGGGTEMCLTFNSNVANFFIPQAFEFQQSFGAQFFVTPPMNNKGNIFESGTITQVTTLPCGL